MGDEDYKEVRILKFEKEVKYGNADSV